MITATRAIDTNATLDGLVSLRREAMREVGGYDFREKRRFLGDDDELTVSLSRYRMGRTVVLILTAIRLPVAVELTGIAARGYGAEQDLLDIMESIQVIDRRESE